MIESRDPEIEALVGAFYAAFDNRDGRTPDGAALRALFTLEAVITRVGAGQADSWTPEVFIAPRVALLTEGALTGFHEWETDARTLVRDNIAGRWSTYRKAGKLDGADYQGGGFKFIQFRRQDGRWLIHSILWEDTPDPP